MRGALQEKINMNGKRVDGLARSILFRARMAAGLPDVEEKIRDILAEAGTSFVVGESMVVKELDGEIVVESVPDIDPNQMTIWEAIEQRGLKWQTRIAKHF